MNQGDNVLLTYPEKYKIPPVEGTLYNVSESHVTVALNTLAPDELPTGNCQLDMLGSDATYKRMRQALNLVKRAERPDLKRLRDIFLGEGKPAAEKTEPINLFNVSLNEYQIQAVSKCLAAEDVAMVHGPPGTGKTTVLVEIILQSVKKGMRVLASAPSNIAVDNLVEKLVNSQVRVVRMGHPARTLESLRHVTLSALEEEHEMQKLRVQMDEERHRLIKQLHRKEERVRGSDYSDRLEIRDRISLLGRESRDMEFAIRRQIIQQADVICATHGGIGQMLSRQKFDLLVMDEASQSTEPLSWIPITLAKKVVFAGDACQLPPTIYSDEASKQGLSTTLFDRLIKRLPKNLQTLLRVQYRMHEDIMTFSSREFYDDKLIADESVRTHTADELENVEKTGLTSRPVVFVDTAGTGYEESWNDLLESWDNKGEAELAIRIYEELRKTGLDTHQIAIITPYVAQVKKLRLMAPESGMEIGSVDSFQGREKEAVIISLVRSNERGEVGFLADKRRLNVALTRARRLLIVIGDSATLSQNDFYKDFIEYVDSLDAHGSAWEWKEN
jgi:superfamily I DNA and/or RNA helicase